MANPEKPGGVEHSFRIYFLKLVCFRLSCAKAIFIGGREMKIKDYSPKAWFFCSTAVLAALVLALCDVYLSTSTLARQREMPEWSDPMNLGSVVNSEFSEVLPHISKNGLSLFFTSDRPVGSFGSFDIWVSQRESRDDPWGPPMNLGPNINTASNDRAPALSRDGHFLFFATSGRGGFGSLDIFVSYRTNTHDDFSWEPP